MAPDLGPGERDDLYGAQRDEADAWEQVAELRAYIHQLRTAYRALLNFDIDEWVETDGTAKVVFTPEQVERIRNLQKSQPN
jgi:hypothetical protein